MRLPVLAIVMTAVIALSAVVRAQQDDTSSPTLRIEWSEFKKLYDGHAVLVIDVRDAASFEAAHIPGARSIPLDAIDKNVTALKKEKDPIVLYCS